MRYCSVGVIVATVWLSLHPSIVRADDLADARNALQKGDLRAAQIGLRNAVRSDPQNAETHYWLGRVSLDLGDPVAAEREARAAKDRGFDPHQAVPLLGQAMLAQQKFNDLLNDLQPAGTDAVLDASILVARGYAELGLKDTEKAQAAFALAEQTAPNAVEPLLASARLAAARGDLEGAQGKVDRALNAQPKSIEAQLVKADILKVKGDSAGAISVLNQMLTDQPGNIRALTARAQLLIAAKTPDKAKADLDAVLKATPGNVQALYLMAVLQAALKDYKTADTTLEKISAFIPRMPRAYFLQAVIKDQLGQTAQAEEAIRRYIARAPNDLAAYKMLARLQFAKRRPDLAAETLAKVIESGHADADTYDLLGRAYVATGRAGDSVKAFQKAEALEPNNVGLQTRLASARMGAGQADAAMGDLEHTLQLAPTAPQVGEALFFAALATGDLNKAADAIDQVRSAQGETPVVENLEGLLKLANLDLEGGKTKFNDIFSKHPDFLPARINLARIAAMQGKPADAEQILGGILVKAPASEPALTMLAVQYAQTNRMPQATALLQAAHKAAPANTHLLVSLGEFYIRSGRPADALALISNEKGADGNIDLLGLKAAAFMGLDQKGKARDTYSQILRIDPTVITARRALESLLVQAGDYERARNLIKEGLVGSPRNYQLYQDYVMVDLKAHGVDAALATARQLIDLDHDFRPAGALIGDVYEAANRPSDAVQAYQDALKTSPDEMLQQRLVGGLVRMGKAGAALKAATDWVANHPDDLVGLEQLADLEIVVKNYDDAVKRLQQILSKKPHNPVALNNLAWVYSIQGDKRAEGLARQAYILSPGGQTADTLGWILVTNGQVQRGTPLLREAVAQAGTDPRVLYHFAVALKDTDQKDEAIKLLNAVLANKLQFDEKADAQKLLDELNKG
ncbi:MAG TPA: XrtA/PEP-CTERM system TPR-repeat protein PrsT [Acetobacteraceae bacterium]|jgi:putative PEP-CTERM system TPR-repeat lipoprotein|nr:XrtA/PEP-CTERM system TPR-repeat protein PrsT [Acetobacteraceae bacterium]